MSMDCNVGLIRAYGVPVVVFADAWTMVHIPPSAEIPARSGRDLSRPQTGAVAAARSGGPSRQ